MQDAASSRYQLPDEDGDEGAGGGLTHMGRSLSEFDTFPGSAAMLPLRITLLVQWQIYWTAADILDR
jgi:hypothetical protein